MNNYTEKDLSINIINKYKDKYKTLKHIRFNKDTKGKCLFDKNNLIGIIQVDINRQYILALEVFDPYKRKGYGGVLLKIAESKLNANKLSVNKKNSSAISLYKQNGWKVYDEDDNMFYMKKGGEKARKEEAKKQEPVAESTRYTGLFESFLDGNY